MADLHDLYARYARDVHRFALYLSGDPALADDITSETFLRAWSSAAPIREGTVKAFVGEDVRWMMVRDNPRQAVALWFTAVACWLVYFTMGRRVRS